MTTWKRFSQERPVAGKYFILFVEDGPPVEAMLTDHDHTKYVTRTGHIGELRPHFKWSELPARRVPRNAGEAIMQKTFDQMVRDMKLEITKKTSENPKDTIGSKKLPFSTLPWAVLAEAAAGMGEGAIKYGKHNYESVGIRYSIYFDATLRHLIAAFLGEDIDPESGIPHITKAISSLLVLRDAQIYNKCTDDRPLPCPPDHLSEVKELFTSLVKNLPDCGKHYDRESIRRRES